MTTSSKRGRLAQRGIILLTALCAAAPALADHPSGLGGGGSISLASPDTLEQGHASAGLRLTYTRPDQRSDAKLEALAGRHIHAHNTDYNLNAAAGVAYGLSDRLKVSAELPYVRRDDLREGEHSHVGGQTVNEVVALGSVAGIGDASVLAKYRLTGEEGPRLALIGGIKLPTGSTHKHSIEGERLETEHQPGTGSWDPIAGAAFSSRFGPVQLTASALYQFSGKGAQDTRLGDRANGGIALAHRFGPAEHHHEEAEHHHDDEREPHHDAAHAHSSWDAFIELSGEWEGRQKVGGEVEEESGGAVVWLSPGARFNSARGWSAAFAVGLPVWQGIRASHPDNDYRLTLALGRAF